MRNRTLYAALLIVAAIAALAIVAVQLRSPRGPVIYAELQAAPHLLEGAPVVFRGIAVGKVTHIAFVANGLRLTIALDRSDVPLRQGDGVRVKPDGMFGGVALEIVPGPGGSAAAPAGIVLHEAAPDPGLLRQQAVGEALLRRLSHGSVQDSGRDSVTKTRAKQ